MNDQNQKLLSILLALIIGGLIGYFILLPLLLIFLAGISALR